jgi:hypothetical protein
MAIGAVAASMLTAIYHMLEHMLETGTLYEYLGAAHFQRGPSTQTKRLVQKLSRLGSM